MFVGFHERQLDDKGRLALPSAFRADVGDACYLVYGEERCIDVFPRAAFEDMAAEMMRQVRAKEISLSRQRAFAHSATLVTLDKQGRITLDDESRRHAGLGAGGQVVIAGALDCLQIWRPSRFDTVRGEDGVVQPSRVWLDEEGA